MTTPIDKAQLRALAEAADDRPYNADATTAFRAAVPAHKVLAMLDEWERTERNRDMWKEQCASQAAQLEALRADAAVEAAATAEARALVVEALAALANPALTWQQSRAEAERILGAWLGEAQKGDGHHGT